MNFLALGSNIWPGITQKDLADLNASEGKKLVIQLELRSRSMLS
jgi:hypothetical protein